MPDRPSIPAPVARQLRQEAGFGCCYCGLPIYQYHHIVPYHEDDPYPPAKMMILCPNHHDAATKGALTVDEQWALKAQPHNIETGLANGLLTINQKSAAVAIGNVFLVGEELPLSIDGEPLLSIGLDRTSKSLTLNARLYDRGDNLLAVIERNEWISGDPLPWDIESDYQYLRIRQRLREIALEIDARVNPLRIRGRLWHGGHAVDLTRHGIRYDDGTRTSGISHLALVGFALDLDPTLRALRMVRPLEQAVFVSHPDPDERLRRALSHWERLTRLGRNDPCWCGSGVKFKKCHG